MKFPFECDIDLVNGYCSGILTDDEFSELERRLRESPELRQMLVEYRSIESALPSAIASGTMEKAEASATKKNRAIRRLKITLLATAAGLILMFGLYFLRPANEQQIATVASMTGSVRWTGAGGQVDDDVQSGRVLTGGTIECLSVDSSAAFEFRDGTTVTISGLSVLTISDNGQKELHLREGYLTAAVETQPEGKPLRVLTAAAELEVRGTQFDVIAAERQTRIIVNKGLVRVTRVTDGSFVDVQAAHSLVTTIEAQEPLVATPVKEPVSVWKANLAKDKGEGDWLSAAHALRLEIGRAVEAGEVKQDEILQVYGDRLANTRDDEGILKAIPKPTGRREQPILYVVSLNISQRQSGPILTSKGSQLRIKGRAEKPDDVIFGFAARNRDRAVQGRFTASRRVESAFDIELPVAELQELGKGDDGASAVGLEVFAWFGWANEPGLEITHVELLAP